MIKTTVIVPVYNQEELIIRALKSIPLRNDLEIIVIDDGSTDKTVDRVLEYTLHNYNFNNIMVLLNDKNRGVAYTVNKGIDKSKGEYIVLLGSDDYFITDNFNKICNNYLNGEDLVYFNLRSNNGDIWDVNEDTKNGLCGSVKFMRREFIGDTRNPVNKRAGEDLTFYQELLKKNPSECFTGITAKHYNYPREGSLTDLSKRGVI